MKGRIEYTKNNSKTVIIVQIFESNRFFDCVGRGFFLSQDKPGFFIKMFGI